MGSPDAYPGVALSVICHGRNRSDNEETNTTQILIVDVSFVIESDVDKRFRMQLDR